MQMVAWDQLGGSWGIDIFSIFDSAGPYLPL